MKNAFTKAEYDKVKNELYHMIEFDGEKRGTSWSCLSMYRMILEIRRAQKLGKTCIIITEEERIQKHIDLCRWDRAYFINKLKEN